MSVETEAPPSVDPNAAGTVPVDTGKTTPEVDIDRVLVDEAYAKEVNEQLAQPEAPAEEPVATVVEDPDPVIDKVIFRGQEREVRKSKQTELLQKGMLLETRLNELSPLIRLAQEAPELAEMVATPEGRQKILERIRQKEQAQPDDDLPTVEGYDRDDVLAVDRIVNARLEQRLGKMGISTQPAPKADPAAAERIAWKARVGLEGLRSVDPEFEGVYARMGEILAEAQRTIPVDQYNQFYAAINNPEVLNEQTGRPAFMHFYDDVRRDYLARKEQTKPVVPNVSAARRTQESSARMAPGAASNPSVGAAAADWSRMPQSDFDRQFAEALARG